MSDPTGGFFSGGAKSLAFGKVGSQEEAYWLNKIRGGKITNVSAAKQQTDWKTKAPLTNDDGSPRMELPITLLCTGGGDLIRAAYAADPKVKQIVDALGGPVNEKTPDPADDGRRTAYVKGALRMAIGSKMRELGAKAPEVGGELYMVYTGKAEMQRGEGRTYEILYFPPAPGSQAGGFFETEQPAAPPVATPPVGGSPFGAPASAPQAPAETPAAPPAQGGNPWGAPAPQTAAPASPWGA
jgi:hypothetical protein